MSLISLAPSLSMAQSGIECEASDGRRVFMAGIDRCPFGLTPAPLRPSMAAPTPVLPGRPPQEVTAIQEALIRLNLLEGPADGIAGPATEGAIRAWQRSQGRAEHGSLSDEEVTALVHDATPQMSAEDASSGPYPFRCPAVGSVLVYRQTAPGERRPLGMRIAVGGSGFACFYLARGPEFGPFVETAMFSAFWRVGTEDEVNFAKALQAERLWPASVGGSMMVNLPPSAGVGERTLEVKFEQTETLHTSAGSFLTIVGRVRDRVTANGETTATIARFWWSPQVGEVLKARVRDEITGAEESWEVSELAIAEK